MSKYSFTPLAIRVQLHYMYEDDIPCIECNVVDKSLCLMYVTHETYI
jgi:hypothetical protein